MSKNVLHTCAGALLAPRPTLADNHIISVFFNCDWIFFITRSLYHFSQCMDRCHARYRWFLAGWGDANAIMKRRCWLLRNWRERADTTPISDARAQSVVMGTPESSFIHSSLTVCDVICASCWASDRTNSFRKTFNGFTNIYLLIWLFAQLYMCSLSIYKYIYIFINIY